MEIIIGATDFSATSLNALQYAAALSADLEAELLLVHVIEVPVTPFQVPLTETEFEEIEKSVTGQMDLLRTQLSLYTKDKITIKTVIKYGLVEVALEDLCKKIDPIAVVLGLKSRGATARLLLGSTALKIIPSAQYPVLIIPEKAVFNGIKSIGIASGTPHIRQGPAISFLKKLLLVFHVQPHIIHVQKDKEPFEKMLSGNIILNDLFSAHNPVFHTIYNENVEQGIFDFIEGKRPDLLVVVPGKYGFLKNLFHDSQSKHLILHAHLPVLALPSSPLETANEGKEILDSHHKNACSGCDGLCCQQKQEENKVNQPEAKNS